MNELKTKIQRDLELLDQWLYGRNLLINSKKSCVVVYNINSKRWEDQLFESITFQNTNHVKRVANTKYLGLHIDSDLKWSTHISHIKRKLAPVIGVFKRVGKYLTRKVALQVYYSQIHSHLSYLLVIWGNTNKTKINDLQVLQNKAIKHLFGLPRLTPTINLYSIVLLPLKFCITYEQALVMYKIRNGLIKFNHQFSENSSVTGRIGRLSSRLRLPSYKLSITMDSIFFKGVDFYNNLSNDTKSMKLGNFKSILKKKLYNNFKEAYEISH